MKLKKIFTVILIILVILGLGASYIFTGFSPRKSAPANDADYFVGPNSAPSVKGPTSAPSLK